MEEDKKIKVTPSNMDLAEKCMEAIGNFIVGEANKFIKSIFVSEGTDTITDKENPKDEK